MKNGILIIDTYGNLAKKANEEGGNNPAFSFNSFLTEIISQHPYYSGTKDPDYCPEGIFQDEDGQFFLQMCCRCKDNEVMALIARFDDGDIAWDSRDFDDEFPF